MKRLLPAIALLTATFALNGCNSDPYESAVKIMEEMATIADTNKDNCDKMGEELCKFADANKSKLEELQKMGKESKDKEADAKAMEKYKDRITAAMGKMMPAQMKCADNAKVQEAGKKLKM